jgi:hypothetical protein
LRLASSASTAWLVACMNFPRICRSETVWDNAREEQNLGKILL